MKPLARTMLLAAAPLLLAAHAFQPEIFCQDGTTPNAHSGQVRYRIVTTETFGGRDGHVATGGAHVLSDAGTFIGSADTTQPDPFAPDGCFNGEDCNAANAYVLRTAK